MSKELLKAPMARPTARVNKPGAGRPRVYATDLPVYDSMEQCSGATGVPLAVLTHAKKNGCLFIRHGRVHFSEFVSWFFNQGDDPENKVDWGKRGERARALLREVDLQQRRNEVIEFKVVDAFIQRLVSVQFFGELEKMKHEFPAKFKGKSEVEIQKECQAQIDRASSNLKRSMEDFMKKKDQINKKGE